ncbi:spermatogenesis-and oogenesis-specific basic helix-loop-helix-containing protein 2 [Plakobranchus ocellatus]|uniref:Spermatogenesis-and oogenesis-specific basic helix-loop-helix-containing protein 2 n=1 Tax=Plakobranchus ocellatus TaxID=259542 RepID=A0AAV4B9X0_9GAST|nr:spermatogenesis-and oogenesis-specific basic helix-loop-helix-containing protein 2 [Plakobranchus ocellatus]
MTDDVEDHGIRIGGRITTNFRFADGRDGLFEEEVGECSSQARDLLISLLLSYTPARENMETREQVAGNKTLLSSHVEEQSILGSNGVDICFSQDKTSEENICGQSRCISTGEDCIPDDKTNEEDTEQKQDYFKHADIKDLGKYEGICKLQELANSARAACDRSGCDIGKLSLPSDHTKNYGYSTQSFFGDLQNNDTCAARSDVEPSIENISPNSRQLPAGPLTRGARKTLEAALAKSLGCRLSSTEASSSQETIFSTTRRYSAIVSTASSPPYTISNLIQKTANSPVPSPLSSPISTAVQCSPAAPSLSSPQLPSSFFDMSNPFFGNGAYTQDEEESRDGSDSSPSRWGMSSGTRMKQDDLDDHSDIVRFINDALDRSVGGAGGDDDLDRSDTDTEWVMDTNPPSSPQTPVTEMPVLKTPTTTPVAMTKSDRPCDVLRCLLITEEKDDLRLENSIQEALQTASIRTASLAESVELCNIETFDLIWVKVSIPVKEKLLTVVASVRYSSGKSKTARIIAIANKNLLVDLLLRLFDDVFLEPLPVATIRQKYSQLHRNKGADTADSDSSFSRDLNTPESSLSLESIKSQSTPSDNSMDFGDLALPALKASPRIENQSRATMALCKSPLITESPSSPAWCKVEHANKEKQRRVRIKDSCDQLRKLLPYVRGRKTDMASILEMTVDYLKIVNASLPPEFQTRVIEMLSPDLPTLDGRNTHYTDTVGASGKSKVKVVDTISKPFVITGKSMQSRATASITSGQILNNDNNINTNISNSSYKSKHSKNDKSANCSIGVITRSEACKSLEENDRSMNACPESPTVQAKTETSFFTDIAHSQRPKSDSNANTIDSGAKNHDIVTAAGKSFPKRELPLNANLISSTPKRPHMILATQTKDIQTPVVYLPSGAIAPLKTKKESIFDNTSNQAHRFPSIQFPHMFTEGDISANRMFSTGHVSGPDVFPHQTRSYLNNARFPGVSPEGGEMVASVNSMYFDTSYYYYPSLHDTSNGNNFVTNGATNEYVNPNVVLPMASNNSARITNFNLGRRYERLSVSSESDRFSLAETTIGNAHQQQQQQPQHQ